MKIAKVPGRRRRGVTLVECGLAYSAVMILCLGTIVLGLGVFRSQQLAWLARQGARWASVHGPTYQSEQGGAAATGPSVMTHVITPRMVALDPAALTCTLTMTSNTATVTLSYRWVPEAFGSVFPTRTLTSTSAAPITY